MLSTKIMSLISVGGHMAINLIDKFKSLSGQLDQQVFTSFYKLKDFVTGEVDLLGIPHWLIILTAVGYVVSKKDLSNSKAIEYIKSFCDKYPKLSTIVIVGGTTAGIYALVF